VLHSVGAWGWHDLAVRVRCGRLRFATGPAHSPGPPCYTSHKRNGGPR
jgi:hypothetical protein